MSDVRFLEPLLKAEVERVSPMAGDVLVVRPKDRHSRFTPEYSDWLRESLPEVLPPGVRAMIISDDATRFSVLSPDDVRVEDSCLTSAEYDAYVKGWHAAFDALQRSCDQPTDGSRQEV
jgi:hypothetical protein